MRTSKQPITVVPRRKKQRVKDHRNFGIAGLNPTWCMQYVRNFQCSVVIYSPMPCDDSQPKPRIPNKIVKLLTTSHTTKHVTVHTLSVECVTPILARDEYRDKRMRLAGRQFLVLPCLAGQSTQPEVLFPIGLQAGFMDVGGTRFEFRNWPIVCSSPVHSRSYLSYETPLHHTSLRVAWSFRMKWLLNNIWNRRGWTFKFCGTKYVKHVHYVNQNRGILWGGSKTVHHAFEKSRK
jgi:hypothetical protein